MENALLRAIIENPDDDAPRLAYADFLEKTGQDPERAAFIRADCLRWSLDRDDPRIDSVWEEAGELLKRHREKWLRGVPQWARQRAYFHRGFVDHVQVDARPFLRDGARLLAAQPVRRVSLYRGEHEDGPAIVEALAASPLLLRVAELGLLQWCFRQGEVETLAASSNLRLITALKLVGNGIGPEDVRVLAASPNLTRLRDLGLASSSTVSVALPTASR
jgi:uncharacterized protein (TIGR02996 family)